MIQTETNLILSNLEIMKKYAELDPNEEERNLLMDKFLTDHQNGVQLIEELFGEAALERRSGDRKSTRLNSSHSRASRMPSSA